jgi:hypothetical protein
MDRSFLSQKDVVAASRHFVCLRLLTYESKEEAKILEWIFVGRMGTLENTVFTVLSSDGKTKLTRSGRSPHQVFGDPPTMAEALQTLAKEHPGKEAIAALPKMADARRALNTAACDNLPLVLVLGENADDVKKLEAKLAPASWKKDFIGKFIYGSSTDPAEVKSIQGLEGKSGIFVVQPGTYGTDGTVLLKVEDVEKDLARALPMHKPEKKDTRSHVESGQRAGVHWKTEIPVTDPNVPPPPPPRRK